MISSGPRYFVRTRGQFGPITPSSTVLATIRPEGSSELITTSQRTIAYDNRIVQMGLLVQETKVKYNAMEGIPPLVMKNPHLY